MTKEEIRQEAEERVNICTPYHTGSFIQGYIAGAEPRENKIADIKANCDLAIEGRDIKIKELELELTVEKDQHQEEIELHLHAEEYIKSLEQQIEKMKRHCNCKHRDSEGYCEVKRTYLMDLSYDGCDKWELED